MIFKLRELVALLVIGALVVIIATGVLVKEYYYAEAPRLRVLATIAYSLAEVPQKISAWVSSIGESPFELDDRFPTHSGFEGQTNRDEIYLLLNRYDGDIEKSVVDLVDLRSFKVVHRWEPALETEASGQGAIEQIDREIRPYYSDVNAQEATHSSLTQRGSLVVGRNGHVSKFDACSNFLWEATIPEGILTNASLELDEHGNIWTAAAKKSTQFSNSETADAGAAPSRHIDNLVVHLSPSGEVIYSKSITDILIEHHLANFIFVFSEFTIPDPLHLVDIQPALTSGTHWQKGDLLISLKHLSMVLLYRPSTDSVLWHGVGHTSFQSDVNFVDGSSLVIFDNNTPTYLQPNAKDRKQKDLRFKQVEGHSKVLVYDFATDQYSHYLEDALRVHQVKTAVQGRNQVLPNGHLFVEETEFGRVLYFNADGNLRWSHVNRAEDGKVYAMGSSRILYQDHEISMVSDFLTQKNELLAECR